MAGHAIDAIDAIELVQDTPFIIVMNKIDLRDDLEFVEGRASRGEKLVELSEAIELGKKLGAFRVVECSALTGQGVTAVFDAAIDAALGFTGTQRTSASSHKKKCIVS